MNKTDFRRVVRTPRIHYDDDTCRERGRGGLGERERRRERKREGGKRERQRGRRERERERERKRERKREKAVCSCGLEMPRSLTRNDCLLLEDLVKSCVRRERGENGGHVIRDTTSRGLCGRV